MITMTIMSSMSEKARFAFFKYPFIRQSPPAGRIHSPRIHSPRISYRRTFAAIAKSAPPPEALGNVPTKTHFFL
jgi:hypothetical protein